MEYNNEEIKEIKLKLNIIEQQNNNILKQIEGISAALLNKNNTKNYNKAVEKFLETFINN
ncbi:hypothetical protein SAMN02745134_00811 [Clostridium acidisoli DSM 12555]|uniref:Uncharacterized protein n=1 Tax=Clostridium acidisoli DSM 12555 TaxID=1121291 RepID=A0A1W1X634_9CLOT|nr:hypothetical protein [Clostridium acidisoli]SMC19364.1 hypothetical protein SAMN02745134_00811 [Clostridium acidisoli DSM 12555]